MFRQKGVYCISVLPCTTQVGTELWTSKIHTSACKIMDQGKSILLDSRPDAKVECPLTCNRYHILNVFICSQSTTADSAANLG